MSLRGMLALAMGALGAIALAGATALLLLTSYLHDTTESLSSALTGVRLAVEMRVDLLTIDRARSPTTRAQLAGALRERLNEFATQPSSQAERDATVIATQRIAEYLSGGRSEDALSRAFQSLESLVVINLDEARTARLEARRWESIGLVTGIAVASLLVLGVGLVLIWLQTAAMSPIFELSESMRRYQQGERNIRAPEIGPRELRAISRQFNEMSAKIQAQHERELTFLAGVAHDLRNPLSALRMLMTMVRTDAPLPAEARLRQIFDVGREQVVYLARMIDDFLDAARIEAGQLDFQMEVRDLRVLARVAVALFDAMSQSHPVTLDMPLHPVYCRCDDARLGEAFNNLLSNAIKYSPEGGPVQVRIGLGADGMALVSVSDQGLGIDPDDLPSIFEPYARSRLSRSSIPGIGLGLSVTKKIVEAHGGRIEVESEPGVGTTFTLRLPCATPPAELAAPEAR